MGFYTDLAARLTHDPLIFSVVAKSGEFSTKREHRERLVRALEGIREFPETDVLLRELELRPDIACFVTAKALPLLCEPRRSKPSQVKIPATVDTQRMRAFVSAVHANAQVWVGNGPRPIPDGKSHNIFSEAGICNALLPNLDAPSLAALGYVNRDARALAFSRQAKAKYRKNITNRLRSLFAEEDKLQSFPFPRGPAEYLSQCRAIDALERTRFRSAERINGVARESRKILPRGELVRYSNADLTLLVPGEGEVPLRTPNKERSGT